MADEITVLAHSSLRCFSLSYCICTKICHMTFIQEGLALNTLIGGPRVASKGFVSSSLSTRGVTIGGAAGAAAPGPVGCRGP